MTYFFLVNGRGLYFIGMEVHRKCFKWKVSSNWKMTVHFLQIEEALKFEKENNIIIFVYGRKPHDGFAK